MWKGLATVQPLAGFEQSEIVVWLPPDSGGDREEEPVSFSSESDDLQGHVPCKTLALELESSGRDSVAGSVFHKVPWRT